MSHDDDSLRVIDTSNSLTKEELIELKKLAAMSKTAKFLFGMVFSVLLFIGFDHLFEWLKHSKT
jgi:energy-converting hydrogenase Eha subunit B